MREWEPRRNTATGGHRDRFDGLSSSRRGLFGVNSFSSTSSSAAIDHISGSAIRFPPRHHASRPGRRRGSTDRAGQNQRPPISLRPISRATRSTASRKRSPYFPTNTPAHLSDRKISSIPHRRRFPQASSPTAPHSTARSGPPTISASRIALNSALRRPARALAPRCCSTCARVN